MAFLEEFKSLRIRLEDIKSATDNFSENKVIGTGGFGKVYKGEVSHFRGRDMAALKRLDCRHGQGDVEFLKEILTLSRYTHENLISLLGFCNESGEKILVYKYACHGSLHNHLKYATLTWRQRLKICLEAARVLNYLHDPRGTHQRVIHCDIKSANILLDDNWTVKLSDFGLSKLGPANQQDIFIISNAVGTIGYIDPMYYETAILAKESDVYSFGVVLFEVLSGKFCSDVLNNQIHILVPTWRKSYAENKLNDIIFQDLIMKHTDLTSMKIFLDIAYQCLNISREERPTMAHVERELEIALKSQENSEGKEQQIDYEEMARTAEPPLNYINKAELYILLSKGVCLNRGKTWFSINANGEHYEMISLAECLTPKASESQCSRIHNSRFAVGSYKPRDKTFKTRVKAQFLSPETTYTVNLVFKKKQRNERYIGLGYKLEGERKCYSFLSDEIENRWMTAELYQFTSNQREKAIDLKIMFDITYCDIIVVEGIEFRPLKKVEDEVLIHEATTQDSITYWEEEVQIDYDDEKTYHILPTRVALKDETWKYLPQTRVETVAQDASPIFVISWEIESIIWPHQTSETTYATYLVYKQNKDEVQPRPAQVKDKNSKSKGTWDIYLHIPLTQVIIRGKIGEKIHSPSHRPKIKGLPQQRRDGWMEVQIWECKTDTTTERILMNLKLSSYDESLEGIVLQGIEFRPIGKNQL